MKEEKFKVIDFIRKLIVDIDREFVNFPKKDIELKNRIRNNSYDLLELSYEANCTNNIENKKEILDKIIAKIKVIDFLLNMSYDKAIINNKKYLKLGNEMDDIIKYTTGWIKSLNKQGIVVRLPLANNSNNLYNVNNNGNINNNNNNCFGVRPVASIHCGYIIKNYIRDNIETNYVLQFKITFRL